LKRYFDVSLLMP